MLREKLCVYALVKGLNLFYARELYFQHGSSVETIPKRNSLFFSTFSYYFTRLAAHYIACTFNSIMKFSNYSITFFLYKLFFTNLFYLYTQIVNSLIARATLYMTLVLHILQHRTLHKIVLPHIMPLLLSQLIRIPILQPISQRIRRCNFCLIGRGLWIAHFIALQLLGQDF